jgi:hypothetical protein
MIASIGQQSPLTTLRAGVAVVLLTQALACAPHLDSLFGSTALVRMTVNEAAQPAPVPRLRWLIDAGAAVGLSESWTIRTVYLAYMAALGGLLLGKRARAMALVAWLLHVLLMNAAWLTTYGVDAFAGTALFYCALFPADDAGPSGGARLGLFVLRCHLCIAYFASGVEKASGEQWWTGEAIWRAAMRPDFAVFDLAWLAAVPWLARALAWSTLVVEIGYPAFMAWKPIRRAWLMQVIGLHLGIALVMGLHGFGALMIVLNVAAWLPRRYPADNLEQIRGRDR